jgi:hypothetical protein
MGPKQTDLPGIGFALAAAELAAALVRCLD